jgi:hypothetical protein
VGLFLFALFFLFLSVCYCRQKVRPCSKCRSYVRHVGLFSTVRFLIRVGDITMWCRLIFTCGTSRHMQNVSRGFGLVCVSRLGACRWSVRNMWYLSTHVSEDRILNLGSVGGSGTCVGTPRHTLEGFLLLRLPGLGRTFRVKTGGQFFWLGVGTSVADGGSHWFCSASFLLAP